MNRSVALKQVITGFFIFILASSTQLSTADSAAPMHSRPRFLENEEIAKSIEVFSDPAAVWGAGVEAVIERAYRECFRTYIIDGQILTLRVPFAENNERAAIAGTELNIVGDGKANPLFIWNQIDQLLASDDFAAYTKILQDRRDKVIIFDLPERQWSVSRDFFDIAQMKAAIYRGMPHTPFVFSAGDGLKSTDVYNYLYSVGRIGIDCSGFVWHVLSKVARTGGIELSSSLNRLLGAPQGTNPSYYVGTSFFDSAGSEFIQVDDRIGDLRPGDIMLFRGKDGKMAHSAVIQSVDVPSGILRYLQSTDEAPYSERGVHDSYIYFDPENLSVSLKDESLEWSQYRFAPFPGERQSYFSEDGERYRAFPEFGGGKVVRLRTVALAIDRITRSAGQ